MISGYYYLHENGDLLFKLTEPEADSDFVRKVWTVDTTNRVSAWRIILEATALGADLLRIKQLAEKWACDTRDLPVYLATEPEIDHLRIEGLHKFLREVVGVDPDAWMDWLAATPKGHEPDWKTMPTASPKGA